MIFATQTVALEDGQTINYDYLVVSLGFESESFGIPGVQEHALQMVDVKTALNVYEHIQEQMRQYKATQNEEFLKLLSAEQLYRIELLGSLVENKPKFAEIAVSQQIKSKFIVSKQLLAYCRCLTKNLRTMVCNY